MAIPSTTPILAPQPYTLRVVHADQRDTWERFTASLGGHLLQSWQWGDLKAQTGWSPLRLALIEQHSQHMIATAQILRRGAPHFPLRLGHLAYLPRGPVLDWSQPALCSAFFTLLDAHLSRRGAIALRLEPDVDAESESGIRIAQQLHTLALQPTIPTQPVRSIILDLTPDETTLLAQLKEKWRYNVRLATRKGVTVRLATTRDDVRSWYTLLQTTSVRDHFGIHTLDYYLHAWNILAPQHGRLLLAEHEGQLLAGIFVSLYARQAIYLYGASSNEQRQLMPNYLLQWEAIRWAKSAGANSYDFWGIPATDHTDEAMAGVYRFKSGWGGRVIQFPGAFERIYHPLLFTLAQRFLAASATSRAKEEDRPAHHSIEQHEQ